MPWLDFFDFGNSSRELLVACIGAQLLLMHNTLRRLKLDPLNFAEEKRSRRRQAWKEGWEGDRKARVGILQAITS